jgi:hypothetical protein
MAKDDTETTTQTSGLSNPAMNAAASTIGNQLNTQLQAGVRPYNESLVPDLSGQTKAGINGLANNPFNASFGSAIGDTMGEFGAIASGQRMGDNDAAWAHIKDDAATGVNATMQGSNRFGSASHAGSLARELAGVDLQRQQGNEQRQMAAAGMLPGLYQGSQLPGQAQLQVGQIQDAHNAADAQDDARRFDATQNAGWNTLQRGSSIFGGTAPVSGTTQTNTQPATPWWQSGASLLGQFI